jgi:DNA-binding NarL/FixJ family response regulator
MKPIKIAIVEHDTATRMMLSGMLPSLSRGSVRILMEAATGAELLYKLCGELPDIVLLDMHTPVMEGIETSGYLQALFPEVTIVALASDSDDFDPALLEILNIKSVLLRDQPLEFMAAAIEAIYSGSVVVPKTTRYETETTGRQVIKSGFLLPHQLYNAGRMTVMQDAG